MLSGACWPNIKALFILLNTFFFFYISFDKKKISPLIFCNSPVTPLNISFFPRNVETLDKESILITLILILILSLLLALSQGKPSYSLVLFDDKNLETEHIKSSRFTYRPVRRFAKPPFLNSSSFCFFLIFILYSFPKPAG